MAMTKALMRAGFRAASYVFFRTTSHADWIYEKVQRPRTCLVLGANILFYLCRVPRIHGIVSLILEPACNCNLRCVYCWAEIGERLQGMRPTHMDWNLFTRIIDDCPKTVETVALGGPGEPLLHPRLPEMVDYIASKGFRPILYCNGTLLKGQRLEDLARTHLAVFNLSIEPDEESCRTYRGVDLAVIKKNVENYVAQKRPETEVKLSLVGHAGNLDRLEKVWETWEGIVSEIKISPRFSQEADLVRVRCMEPWRGSFFVMSSGKVTPCCFDCFEELTVGDINDESFREIIRGPKLRALLASFFSKNPPARCKNCAQFQAPKLPLRAPKSTVEAQDRP